jgi:hypothetical protein
MIEHHDCPHEATVEVGLQLEKLHTTQAGDRRHRCVACSYKEGFQAGYSARKANRRVASWPLQDAMEMCEEGHAAPTNTLRALPECQGEFRHGCAVCAWSLGWAAGVKAAEQG